MGIIQHTQMFRHDPDNGVYGDCWRATVACLLRLPVEDVPHVCDGPDDGKASERMRAFLESQDCALIQVPFNGDMSLQQILEYVGAISVSGGLHWCLMGTSRTGCNHVVICKGSEIIHDPSITQSGIVGPASDGLWWVEWIVQRTACDSPAPSPNVVGIHLTLTRALGMYGAAYDPPGPHRAYTYEHQPANGPAWNLGCAVSALQQYKPGDAIDTGLYLLKEMQARGLGIFEIEPKAIDAPPPQEHLAGSQPQHVLSVTQHPNVESPNGEQRGIELPGQNVQVSRETVFAPTTQEPAQPVEQHQLLEEMTSTSADLRTEFLQESSEAGTGHELHAREVTSEALPSDASVEICSQNSTGIAPSPMTGMSREIGRSSQARMREKRDEPHLG